MGRIAQAVIILTFLCGKLLAGDAGQYGRSLELRNWLIANHVEVTDSVEIFLSLPDEVPISDTSGLIKSDPVFRTTNQDKTRGWINRVIRRLHVAENGHSAYWVYHIETKLVFDLGVATTKK